MGVSETIPLVADGTGKWFLLLLYNQRITAAYQDDDSIRLRLSAISSTGRYL
jgi:hypothetical protein